MFLPDRSGIRCDLCLLIEKEQFTYYSVDFLKIRIVNKTVIRSPDDISYDICKNCYNKWLERCKNNVSRALPNTIKCDFCPEYMASDFVYYKLDITVANVDIKREKPVESKKYFMDYNVGECCINQYFDIIKTNKEKIKTGGNWS